MQKQAARKTRCGGALALLAALAMSLVLVLAPAAPAYAEGEVGTYAEGSVGFFRWLGADEAEGIILSAPNNPVVAPYQDEPADSPQSAFNLDSMRESLSIIERCNQIRVQEGLPELLVDPYLMAAGQVNANYSSVIMGHSGAYNIGENVAWGYADGASAFQGWYTQEKNLWLSSECAAERAWFESLISSGSSFNAAMNQLHATYPDTYQEVGHYLNIISPDYKVTGAGQADRRTTYEQAFYFSASSDGAYSLSEFSALLDEYYASVTGDEPGSLSYPVSIVQPEHARIEVYNNVGADFDGTFPEGHHVAGEIRIDEGYVLEDVIIDGPLEYTFAPFDNVENAWVFNFDMPAASVTVTAVVAPESPSGEDGPHFSDVTSGWYYDAVMWVAQQGIMNGQGEGDVFGPTDPLGRGALAQLLYNMNGRPDVTSDPGYADANPGDWWYDAVAWCTERGAMTGYGPDTFGPGDTVTREQLVTVIWRLEGEPAPTTGLDDYPHAGSVSSYAHDAMAWAVGEGIVSGSGGNLEPQVPVNRATAATIIARWQGGIES